MPEDDIDWLNGVPVYHSVEEVEQAMCRVIQEEKEQVDVEHEAWGRDVVLAALVAYLAEGLQEPEKERVLRILDTYCGRPPVIESQPQPEAIKFTRDAAIAVTFEQEGKIYHSKAYLLGEPKV